MQIIVGTTYCAIPQRHDAPVSALGKRTVQKQGRKMLTALHELYWRVQSGYPV
jgi:hypothetical protein